MPQIFTVEDRARIRDVLLETGRTLFTKQGLRKTSLEELTQPAGIHKTSFYSFFESKEALYLELLALEQPAITTRIDAVLADNASAEDKLVSFLRVIFDVLETNDLVQRLITHPEEMQMVAARVRREDIAAKTNALLPIRTYIEHAVANGQIVDRPPDLIVGILRSITMLTLHRREIGDDLYPQVIDTLIQSVAAQLTRAT